MSQQAQSVRNKTTSNGVKTFDLIIIGGGAGAFAAAIRANELKAKTALINAGLPLGGTCVNVGCVPSNALIRAGEIINLAKNHGIPGLELEVKNFNFQKIAQDELALVKKLRQEKYEKVLAGLDYVNFFEGRAIFTDEKEVEVNGETFAAEKFIIAAGSTAIVPAIEGIRGTGFLTHIEALQLEQLPKELIVVGAGPLGLEFAQMYSRFGIKVTILQRSASIFPQVEKELANRLAEIFTAEGIVIKTNVEIKKARLQNSKKIFSCLINGKEEEIAAEEILLTAGKTSNTQKLGLEKVGIKINEKQAIVVNNFFQTSQPHIFAIGDVAALPMRLEPTAGHEGTLAAENALKGARLTIDYNAVPHTIFTDPQLAGVGLTEDEQIKKIGVCTCRTVSFSDIPRAIINRRTEGLIKMTIDPRTGQILGTHILAPNAGEIISEAMMLIKNKNTVNDIIESLPMFPTFSEAIKLAALSFTKDISKISCCI